MSRVLFVSDIHLCQQQPAITAGFLQFLAQEAPHCSALYLLGDLFEAWIGDDDPNPLHQQVASALNALPVPVFFVHGNRDFLVGQSYAQCSGMQLLGDETVLDYFGHRVLIMHGDTLCTDDVGYQRLRRHVHRRWLQKLFLALPLGLRQRIAERMRQGSSSANSQKSQAIMDVNPKTVMDTMSHHHTLLLIHGHTHRPAVHQLEINHKPAQRMVLGAWHQQGSFIVLDSEGLRLLPFNW